LDKRSITIKCKLLFDDTIVSNIYTNEYGLISWFAGSDVQS